MTRAKTTAALLSGKEPPKHEDNETTFADLRGRIAKCLAYLETFSAADFEATKPDALIQLPNRPARPCTPRSTCITRQWPNFSFHVTTAYNLLRHGGVEIGKSDYLGPLNIVDV